MIKKQVEIEAFEEGKMKQIEFEQAAVRENKESLTDTAFERRSRCLDDKVFKRIEGCENLTCWRKQDIQVMKEKSTWSGNLFRIITGPNRRVGDTSLWFQ